MSLIRFPEEINPELPGIICISHGPLACAIIESAEMIVGELENMAALGLEQEDSLEEYSRKLIEIIEKFPKNSIILVDLFGGTPANTLMKAASKPDWTVTLNAVSGLNLPMVLEAIHNRENCRGDELVSLVLQGYENGAVNLGKCVSEMMS